MRMPAAPVAETPRARGFPTPATCRSYNSALPFFSELQAWRAHRCGGKLAWNLLLDSAVMIDQDQLSPLIEPEVILPEQFFSGPRRGQELGEHRLMAAILDDAVLTYCVPQVARARGGGRAEREARAWIESTDRSWVFSFERICEALDLDAEYIRRGVQTWKQRTGRRRAVVIDLQTWSRLAHDDGEGALRVALDEARAPMCEAEGARRTSASSS